MSGESYLCIDCGKTHAYLLEGKLCKGCYPWEDKRAEMEKFDREYKKRLDRRVKHEQRPEVIEKRRKVRARKAMMARKIEKMGQTGERSEV